jgi:hypothetical protein
VPQDNRYSGPERRDKSQGGLTRRARFEASVKLLADLGLSASALDYYRRLARKRRVLPHELVCEIVEKIAEPDTVVLGRMGLDPSRPT